MHENREISSAPSVMDEGRSVKAHSRTTDMHVLEKSDCAVLPVNRPNKGRQLPAEAGEGRAQLEENIVQAPHAPDSEQGYACSSVWTVCVKPTAVYGSPSRRLSFRRAVCVNAHVRICAGGDQR